MTPTPEQYAAWVECRIAGYVRRNISDGMTPEDALTAAIEEFHRTVTMLREENQ